MKNGIIKLALLLAAIGLVSCSTNPPSHPTVASTTKPQTAGQTSGQLASGTEEASPIIGGDVGRAMNDSDKSKLGHALDKAPGTPTTWVNNDTNTTFTATPTEKVTINGNANCRKYNVTATTGTVTKQTTGTACVMLDAEWHTVAG